MSKRLVSSRFCGSIAVALMAAAALSAPLLGAVGDLLWEQRVGKTWWCPDVVALRGRVFTYSTGLTNIGRPFPVVRAYDLQTGERLWESSGRIGYNGFLYVIDGLAAFRGRVFSAATHWPSGAKVLVSARDAATGALLWRRELADGEHQFRVFAVQASDDGVFLVGRRAPGTDGDRALVWSEVLLMSLDPRNGETLWEDVFNRDGGADQGYGIAIASRRVVITAWDQPRKAPARLSAYHTLVRTYDAATGSLLWQDVLKGTLPTRLTISRDRVFSLLGATDGTKLAAHDLRSGERLWERRTTGILGEILASARRTVAVYGIPLDFAGSDRLQVYDGETGRQLWRRRHQGHVRELVADRGRLFTVGLPSIETNGLAVEAYRLRTGRARWSHRREDPQEIEFSCSAVVHQGVLVTGGTEQPGEVVTAFEP